MRTVEGTLKMDDYEFSNCMARGVNSGLFTFRLLGGGACFIFLFLFALVGYADGVGFLDILPPWHGRLIPWMIVVSLLVAIFSDGVFGITGKALQDTLRQIAKESQCRELSVNIRD
jgi:hypothetical protein